jgi:hypothetical protein
MSAPAVIRGAVVAAFGLAALIPTAVAEEAGLATFRAGNYCRILAYLQAIYRYPIGTINRYVIADLPGRPETYVQCWIAPDRRRILCEAASGRFLRPIEQLVPAEKLPLVAALGYGTDPGRDNFRQEHDLHSPRELEHYAELYIRSFVLLYGASPETVVRLEAPLVRRPPPAPRDTDICRPLIG